VDAAVFVKVTKFSCIAGKPTPSCHTRDLWHQQCAIDAYRIRLSFLPHSCQFALVRHQKKRPFRAKAANLKATSLPYKIAHLKRGMSP
jgi:hypothetical protein